MENPNNASFGADQSENFVAPSTTVSSPDSIECHMILDLELNSLVENEDSKISSCFQTCLGAVIGFSPAVLPAIVKSYIRTGHDDKMDATDFISCMCFAICIAIMVICYLINFGRKKKRDNLIQKIRNRQRKTLNNK